MPRLDSYEVKPSDLEVEPISRAETIPSAWYTDPSFYDLELEAVFRRTWQLVGPSAPVAEPGCYTVAEVAENPIIIVRDHDGVLRAFYNVCRHRGGPLATEDGCGSVLKCRYHGWTYRLDGTLRGVPAFDRVELFDKSEYGLQGLAVREWHGLVFVNLGSEDAGTLEAVWQEVDRRIEPYDLDAKQFYRRVEYDMGCNWKVYQDNYLEGYHVPHVHPELYRIYDFRSYRTEVGEHHSLQISGFGTERSGYNPTGEEAYYYSIFPNWTLNVLPGRLQTNIVLPLGVDRCKVIFDYFYDDITSPESLQRISEDESFSDKVQREDIDICERVQAGLASRGYDRGRFSVEYEEAVYHFQSQLKRHLSAELGAGLK